MSKEKELMDLIVDIEIDIEKIDSISDLIAEGVDINYTCTEEDQVENLWLARTPLLQCIATGGITLLDVDLEVFELLIEHGVKTDITDELGNTPVLVAIKYLALEALKLLVQQGANIYDKNTAGENVFDIIVAKYYEEAQELGEDLQAGGGEAYERMLERIDAIVENGYDLKLLVDLAEQGGFTGIVDYLKSKM